MKRFKVRYIGNSCFEFDYGQEVEAKELSEQADPKKWFYAITSLRDGEEYAFPRELFEFVEELPETEDGHSD